MPKNTRFLEEGTGFVEVYVKLHFRDLFTILYWDLEVFVSGLRIRVRVEAGAGVLVLRSFCCLGGSVCQIQYIF